MTTRSQSVTRTSNDIDTSHTATVSHTQASKTVPLAMDSQSAYTLDMVLKSGWMHKRTRKTKNWKKRWFVLRGDRLSCYKDNTEYKVHRQILLSEMNACAMLKDAKREHVFGIFSASRNYYLQGVSLEDAQEWVDLICKAAALGEIELQLSSGIIHTNNNAELPLNATEALEVTNSPPFSGNPSAGRIQPLQYGGFSSQTLEYSGAEAASCSSFSDTARISQLSLSHPEPLANALAAMAVPSQSSQAEVSAKDSNSVPGIKRNGTGLSTIEMENSRIVWHGYLWCLKSKGGVRQWKKLWVVLRPINVAFYKNEQEYRTIRLIPLDSVIDAVDIDPLSRSKKFCMQMITEEKSYRFAASDEDQLAKFLGAFKVTLAKHRRFD